MTLPDRLFPPSPPLIRTVLSFVAGVFILMVPVAAWLTLTGTLTIDLYWTVSAFFGVQVLATLLYSLAIARPGGVLAATAILLVLSTGIEFVGVTTGFPFGSYYYSYFLDPFVAGNVPLAIPLLWFVLVVNAFFLSTVGVKDGAGPFRSLLLAGVMVVGMGILLEPFAASVFRFWTWIDGSSPLHSVPGRTMMIALSLVILQRTVRRTDDSSMPAPAFVPAGLLLLNGLIFAVAALAHGYWLTTLAGLVILSGCVLFFRPSRTHRP